NRCCLVRAMTHGNADHDGGMHVCLTGHSRPQEATPCFGSVTSRLRPARASLPSYMWLQNLDADVRPWYLTGGNLGPAHAPLLVGKGADNAAAPHFRVTAFAPAPDVSMLRLEQRHELLANLESGYQAPASSVTGTMRRHQQRALELIAGPEAR